MEKIKDFIKEKAISADIDEHVDIKNITNKVIEAHTYNNNYIFVAYNSTIGLERANHIVILDKKYVDYVLKTKDFARIFTDIVEQFDGGPYFKNISIEEKFKSFIMSVIIAGINLEIVKHASFLKKVKIWWKGSILRMGCEINQDYITVKNDYEIVNLPTQFIFPLILLTDSQSPEKLSREVYNIVCDECKEYMTHVHN